MRSTLLALFLVTIMQTLSAQNPDLVWTGSMGGSQFGSAEAICWDSSDNIYTVGKYNGTFDFDPDFLAYNISSSGNTDMFIHKTSPEKDLVWVKSFGDTGNDMAYDIITDADGNVYVTGEFIGIINFLPGVPAEEMQTTGYSDIFLVKFNSDGTYQWSNHFGGGNNDAGLSLGLDGDGNVYVSGYFSTSINLTDDVETIIHAVGARDVFIIKTDPSGEPLWVKTFGGSENDIINDMLINDQGEAFLTGSFKDLVDFDTSSSSNFFMAEGFKDAYVLKLDTNGDTEFIYTIGDNIASLGDKGSEGVAMVMDDNNDIYITGFFSGSPDMLPGPSVQTVTSNGDTDVFIQKIHDNSDLVWVKTYGGIESDQPTAIANDQDMDIYLSGIFASSVDFDPNDNSYILTSLDSGNDAYIQKLNRDGVFIWASAIVSNFGHRINGIVTDNNNHFYIAGNFAGGIDMNLDVGGTYLNAIGSYDAYITKFNNCISINDQVFTSSSTLIANAPDLNYQWLDCDAGNIAIPGATEQIYTNPAGGTYAVEISNGDCSIISACYTISAIGIGIDENDTQIALNIAPNPSRGVVSITLSRSYERLDVKIRNIMGQLIAEQFVQNTNAFELSIDAPAGLYLIEIRSNTGASSLAKIIKE